jgi:hypothetical protein
VVVIAHRPVLGITAHFGLGGVDGELIVVDPHAVAVGIGVGETATE